jgi:hypothetical protein
MCRTTRPLLPRCATKEKKEEDEEEKKKKKNQRGLREGEAGREGEVGWVFCSHFKLVYFFLDA